MSRQPPSSRGRGRDSWCDPAVAKRELLTEVIGAVAQLGHVVGQRRTELQVPIGGEDHPHRCREGLGDRADTEGRIPADQVASPMLQLADLDRHGLAAPVDGKLGSGDAGSVRELGDRRAGRRPEGWTGGDGSNVARGGTPPKPMQERYSWKPASTQWEASPKLIQHIVPPVVRVVEGERSP